MGKQKPLEMITPPNALKAKIGGAMSRIDEDAIRRAEMALESISHEFDDWIDEEVQKLEASWKAAKKGDGDAETLLELVYGASHDLKGLAKTYGYPLVTRYAKSLCTLLDTPERRAAASAALIEAHVATCRVAVRDRIKADDHPVGIVLATELEKQVVTALN